jgi:hypothetical protein
VKATRAPSPHDPSVRTSIAWIDALGAAFVRSRRALQLATGVFLALLGIYIGRVRIELMLDGTRTSGRIVAYEQRLLPTSGTSTARTLAFMPVVYRAADPSVAMIDRRVGNWLPWAPILALGLFLSLDAVRAYVVRRRSS